MLGRKDLGSRRIRSMTEGDRRSNIECRIALATHAAYKAMFSHWGLATVNGGSMAYRHRADRLVKDAEFGLTVW
jgi:hypothetical protein